MATRKKSSKGNGRSTTVGRSRSAVQDAKKHTDRNEQRREKYARDPVYAETQRRRFRDHYRKKSGGKARPASDLEGGKLLARAQSKEVEIRGDQSLYPEPVVALVFTVRETAQALGKSELTLRRWIKAGMIPPARLFDTSYGYQHYSRGELRIIARILARHAHEFDYLHKRHESTIGNIWDAVQNYREGKV
jgi:hypothetical protein